MKRIAISLLFSVLCMVVATAQQLPGVWTINQNQSGLDTQSRFVFNNDQTLTVEVNAAMNRNDIGNISCHADVNGTWEQQDSLLYIRLDMESLNLEFDRMDFTPAIAELVNQGSVYGNRINQMARDFVADGMRRRFGGTGNIKLTITTLTDTQLQVRSDRARQTLDFQRE